MSIKSIQEINKAADLQTQITVLENIVANLKKEYSATVLGIHDMAKTEKEWNSISYVAKSLGVQL